MYLKYSGYTKREVRHEVQAKRAEEEWEAAIREYEEQEIKRNDKNLGGSNNEKNKALERVKKIARWEQQPCSKCWVEGTNKPK